MTGILPKNATLPSNEWTSDACLGRCPRNNSGAIQFTGPDIREAYGESRWGRFGQELLIFRRHGKDMARTHAFLIWRFFAHLFFVWSCREEFSAGAARQVTNSVLLYHLFHAQSTALGLSSAYLPANQIQTRVDNEASSGQLLEYMIIYQWIARTFKIHWRVQKFKVITW